MSSVSNNNIPKQSVTTTVVDSQDRQVNSSKETPLPNPIATSTSTAEPPTDRYLKLKQGASVLAKKISQAITKFLDMALNDKKPTANTATRTQVTQQASRSSNLVKAEEAAGSQIAICHNLVKNLPAGDKKEHLNGNLEALKEGFKKAKTVEAFNTLAQSAATLKKMLENAS